MKKVIVVVGPTSVGKTAMGVSLAKELNGEVISGDSMQIYRHLNIGSAKVTTEEMDGVIHHLIDICDPLDTFSVKDFQEQVRTLIDDITRRDKVPIIVGGTGLYIKAALYDYSFQETTSNHDQYKIKYQDYTNEQLHTYLNTIDKESAIELHPNNRQRVLRAIEIFETSGTKKSAVIASQQHVCLYDAVFIGLTIERECLYERINKRVDIMIQNGLQEEIETLRKMNVTSENQSAKGIGYREWFAYYDGTQTLEQTIELIKKNSRNYAKRQYTWFKNQFNVNWYDVNLEEFASTVKQVLEDIKKGSN